MNEVASFFVKVRFSGIVARLGYGVGFKQDIAQRTMLDVSELNNWI